MFYINRLNKTMKNNKFKLILLILPLYLVCISCTKEIDLNQADDLEINPITTISLFHFDAPANNFIIGNSNAFSDGDFVQIDIFNNSFIDNNLVRAELEFETINSINRDYEVQIDFLDDSNEIRHTFTFSAEASPNNENITTRHIEVFEDTELSNLKQTSNLAFTLTMLPGEPVNSSTPGNISLKSKATFFLNIKR